MIKHLREIRKTYVRQLGRNDCGLACLCMILKFQGIQPEDTALRNPSTFINQDLSLLDLRNIARSVDLDARCVTMEMEFLATNKKPCILHLKGTNDSGHFQVCYGAESRKDGRCYLMADPARGIYFLPEPSLDELWLSRAALYFDCLKTVPAKLNRPRWHLLITGELIPKALLVSIPLLHIFTAVLGIAWSWSLQRGINSSIADKSGRLIIGMILLLLIVTLSKNLFSFVRQQLMLRLNSTINRHLMSSLIRSALERQNAERDESQSYLKNRVVRLMKMQQAVSAFLVTILSEGSLVVLVITGLIYQSPVVGLINLLYLAVLAVYTNHTFPGLLFDNSHLNELSGSTEKMILQDMRSWSADHNSMDRERAFGHHSENHLRYLKFAEEVSSRISRNSFVQECLGTFNVIAVFVYGILKMKDWSMSYSVFVIIVILSYFVTAIMPKICSSLFIVSEGIEASRDYKVI